MSVSVLVTGALFRDPEERTSGSSGKPFVVATIRAAAADNEPADYWNVLAFSESVRTELMRLRSGDRASIQGRLKLELYEKGGEARISRSVFADGVLALRAPPKERRPRGKDAPSDAQLPLQQAGAPPQRRDDLNDDIPF
jgi:single-stranded DNA-binding protein